MSKVIMLEDESLYCMDCDSYVLNTANYEMRKEGCFAHSHYCMKEGEKVSYRSSGNAKPADLQLAKKVIITAVMDNENSYARVKEIHSYPNTKYQETIVELKPQTIKLDENVKFFMRRLEDLINNSSMRGD